MSFDGQLPPKARLLRAAAELLAKSAGAPVSTRQITQLAGVTAPTLYHHFGDKEGLFDAVVTAGFEEYVKGEREFSPSGKPLEDIRRMWDNHVRFGLSQPELYLVMFGNIRPERRPSIVADAEAFMEEMLNKAAVAGQLNVSPKEAARSILAANVGVTLMLIAEPATDRNLELSTMTRDAMIFAVSADQAKGAAPDSSGRSSVVVAAIALNAALQASHSEQLSNSELKLFLEWLHRISNSSANSRGAQSGFPAPETADVQSDILAADSVILSGTATTRDAAIYEAGRLLLDRGAVDSGYITAMHEREESVSTYMGSYLAIPHGTNAAKDHIRKSAVSVVRYPHGIDWNGKEVRFVVGVAGISNEHLHILSSIAEVFAEKAQVAQLEAATSVEEVLELFGKVNSGDF